MWGLWLGVALAREVTVPVDIGLGPALHGISGPVRQDQTWHYGATLTLEAIVTHDTIKKFKRRIPEKYRDFAMSIDEARIRPLWFLLPEALYLSPRRENTGVWGATWQLLGISVPLVSKPFRFALEPGIPFTVMSVTSDTLPSPTTFVRLGLEGAVDLEIPITPGFLISGGWNSAIYPPQRVGGGVFDFGPTSESIWHIGTVYAQLHVRVPVTVDI